MTEYYLYINLIIMILVGFIGIVATLAGFLGIQRRRPLFIIHRGWFLGYYLLFFVFTTLLLASLGINALEIDNEKISFGTVLVVVLISAFLTFLLAVLPSLWGSRSTSSVMILGINGKVMDLLGQALEKEGIAYREINEYIKLPDLDAMIHTTQWSVVGYAALKIDPKKARPVLGKIIQTIKAYDKDHSDHFSLRFMILLVFFGLVLSGVGVLLAYSLIKIIAIV
jgi:hypothetical protein